MLHHQGAEDPKRKGQAAKIAVAAFAAAAIACGYLAYETSGAGKAQDAASHFYGTNFSAPAMGSQKAAGQDAEAVPRPRPLNR